MMLLVHYISFNTAQHVVRAHLIDANDVTEKTPLDYAIKNGHPDVMNALISWGAATDFYQRNMLITVE